MFATNSIVYAGNDLATDILASVLRDYVPPLATAGDSLDWTLSATAWHVPETVTVEGVTVPSGAYVLTTVGKTDALYLADSADSALSLVLQVRSAHEQHNRTVG